MLGFRRYCCDIFVANKISFEMCLVPKLSSYLSRKSSSEFVLIVIHQNLLCMSHPSQSPLSYFVNEDLKLGISKQYFYISILVNERSGIKNPVQL